MLYLFVIVKSNYSLDKIISVTTTVTFKVVDFWSMVGKKQVVKLSPGLKVMQENITIKVISVEKTIQAVCKMSCIVPPEDAVVVTKQKLFSAHFSTQTMFILNPCFISIPLHSDILAFDASTACKQ